MSIIDGYASMFRRHHNKLLIIPILMLIASIGFLIYHASITGEVVNRGISLKGGIAYTIGYPQDPDRLFNDLRQEFKNSDFSFKTISSGTTKQLVIEASDIDTEALKSFLEEKGFSILQVEIVGATLGEDFFRQAVKAIIIAFIAMSIIVLIYFRTIIPSLAVVLSAFSDIIEVVAIITLLGIKLNTPGIAALLMLIGYSVDTDILLTTRMIKPSGEKRLEKRLASAMKTGLTMTITTFGAVLVAYLLAASEAIKQIMLIVMIGLVVDLFNTWIQNSSIIVGYAKRKRMVE